MSKIEAIKDRWIKQLKRKIVNKILNTTMMLQVGSEARLRCGLAIETIIDETIPDTIDTLTSELEAERKAKEEAIQLLNDVNKYENTVTYSESNASLGEFGVFKRINNFLKTHTVSKGEE